MGRWGCIQLPSQKAKNAAEEKKLRESLASEKVGVVKKRAKEAKLDAAMMEQADMEDDPKAFLIDLIVQAMGAARLARPGGGGGGSSAGGAGGGGYGGAAAPVASAPAATPVAAAPAGEMAPSVAGSGGI